MKNKVKSHLLDDSYLTNWEALNGSRHPVKKSILSDWERLLDLNLKEDTYHKFLAQHAGFFFYETMQDTIVISKMKFGADFISDFVMGYDRGSDGFQYELIELERPGAPLFTKYNKITAPLNTAIQQIQSWKAWLLKYSGSIRNQFPSSRYDIDGFLNLKYTIIIGKREILSDYETKQRNLLAMTMGISIRSYDYLTDKLKKVVFTNEGIFFNDRDNKTKALGRQYSNPFYNAYTDKQWREMLRLKRFYNSDMVSSNIEHLLEYRTYNFERLKQFEDHQRVMLK